MAGAIVRKHDLQMVAAVIRQTAFRMGGLDKVVGEFAELLQSGRSGTRDKLTAIRAFVTMVTLLDAARAEGQNQVPIDLLTDDELDAVMARMESVTAGVSDAN